MNTTRRLALVIAVFLITTPLATVSATSTVTSQSGDSSRLTDGAGGAVLQQDTPTNNSTVHHEPPDEASEGSDPAELRGWLSDRLGDALVACAREARRSGNGTCQTLDEEYPSLASRYADIAQETEDTGDDNVSRVLNRTGDNQERFVRTVREYRDSLAAYREARQQNDLPRARSLARNVSQRGTRVVAIGGRLSADYRTIDGNSTMPISPALEITEEVTENVSNTTEEIRTSEFNPPDLNVSSNASTASFTAPALIRGRLQSQNGTPLGNRTVAVRTPETTIRTQTDGDGTFAVTYRPKTAPVGNATIDVQYLPRNDSQYTGVSAQTNLTVRAVAGNLSVDSPSSGIVFGEDVTARGTLRVDGTPVAGVPVALSLGNVSLGVAETNASGGFALTERLPASVANGSPMLTASVAQPGIAVEADPASTTVSVNETTPSVRAQSERLDADTASVSGSMIVGDIPVSGAEIELRKDGDVLGTVRTGEEGTFSTNVSLPDVPANETTTLAVVYDPPGGNLAPIELQLPVSTAPESNDIAPDVDSPSGSILPAPLNQIDPIFLALGVLLVLLVFLIGTGGNTYGSGMRLELAAVREQLGIVWAFLGGETDDDASEAPDSEFDSDSMRFDDVPADDSDVAGVASLQTAQDHLYGGEMDEAVVAAYRAARRHLDARFGIDATLTHGELLTAYRDVLGEERGEALERLTSAYERAAFSPGQNTVDSASDALESADVIVGYGLSTDADRSGDD